MAEDLEREIAWLRQHIDKLQEITKTNGLIIRMLSLLTRMVLAQAKMAAEAGDDLDDVQRQWDERLRAWQAENGS
ncbi:MAG TPA: hypothetical protein VK457_20125 [Chloroflexota bacterium]|nr:hypothetical protein [Chloroflexota bacterium]